MGPLLREEIHLENRQGQDTLAQTLTPSGVSLRNTDQPLVPGTG